MEPSSSYELYKKLDDGKFPFKKQYFPYFESIKTLEKQNILLYVVKFFLLNKLYDLYKENKEKELLLLVRALSVESKELKESFPSSSQNENYDKLNLSLYQHVQDLDDLKMQGSYTSDLMMK